MSPQDSDTFFRRLQTLNPHPKSELTYVNTFTLLVAVVLSAQATDVGVNKATKALFEKVTTPQEMVHLGLEELKEYIKTIGPYHTKAKNIIALSEILVNQHNSNVPNTREALEHLPGVGRKTANVVLNIAFGQPTLAVDTHIFRVANRTGLAPGKTPREVEDLLVSVTPPDLRHDAHHWLILHGRYICKAKKPDCFRCPVVDLCSYPNKNLV